MPTPSILATILLGWLAGSEDRADDPPPPTSLVLVASDFPGGISVPVEGSYTIKVWANSLPDWSFKPGNPPENPELTLTPKLGDARPGWQTLGVAKLATDRPIRIAIEKTSTVPVPSILSLSTDPEFTASNAFDILRGQVRSTGPTPDRRRSVVRSNEEGANFEPPDSPRAWKDRARVVREQLLVTLSLWPMPPKTELNPKVVGTIDRDGYAIDRVVLETHPSFFLAANLYRPTTPGGKRPVVLCPHGHWDEGRVNVDVQSRCVRLAQLGCIVLMYDMVGFADGKPFGHAFLDDRLNRWGMSLPGLQTWNSIRALDWLLARPDVDPARVGITGESGGGTQTFLLSAIDSRIKVSAPVVMVSDGFQGGCVCENGAGLRLGTDNVEFAALTAPRPMKLVGASGDWTARTLTNALPTLQLVYAHSGATHHLDAEVFNFPHNYNQTSRNAVYAFLAKWLLGIGDPDTTREGTLKVEDPKDLYVFNDRNPYPSDARTPAQLEADLIGVAARQLDKLEPGTLVAPWEASRALLNTSLRVRVGLENPAPRQTLAREVRRVTRDGLTIVHFVVGRRAQGESIPVVRLIPENFNGRSTVIFTARGKADLTNPDGSPTPMARALLDRGQSVVGFDPLLVGESFDPASNSAQRPQTVYFDCYNPSLAADRAQDLASVVSWTRALADVREVNLVGHGPIGPLGLLARPMIEGISRTAIDLDGFDYGDGSKPVPPGLDLPGVLQFGGLKAAAALTAPAPLWLSGTGEGFADAWPIKAYALGDSSSTLRLDRGSVDVQAVARWIDLGE